MSDNGRGETFMPSIALITLSDYSPAFQTMHYRRPGRLAHNEVVPQNESALFGVRQIAAVVGGSG